MNDQLLEELVAAEHANTRTNPRRCAACVAIEEATGERKEVLTRALAGTIGQERLSKILAANGIAVSERAIRKHRTEEKRTP